MAERGLEVLATGPLVLVQDLGRPGLSGSGVGRSGAADRGAFRLGARLLAQDGRSAALEVLLGGLAVRALGDLTLALTGAPAPATVDGTEVGFGAPLALPAGSALRLGRPPAGLRTYVSVRGGIAVAPVLGSRSTDTLSGIGPPPVAAGTVLPVGPPPPHFPTVDVAPLGAPDPGPAVLLAWPGPRDDWIDDLDALWRQTWTVSAQSNRVGLRLEGTPLRRAADRAGRELPSEGVVRGAVQVPAGGEPIIFLADHPVTGGYPVVAVLADDDADAASQLAPGQLVRLRRR